MGSSRRWWRSRYAGRRYLGVEMATGTLEEAQVLAQRRPVFPIEDA